MHTCYKRILMEHKTEQITLYLLNNQNMFITYSESRIKSIRKMVATIKVKALVCRSVRNNVPNQVVNYLLHRLR